MVTAGGFSLGVEGGEGERQGAGIDRKELDGRKMAYSVALDRQGVQKYEGDKRTQSPRRGRRQEKAKGLCFSRVGGGEVPH